MNNSLKWLIKIGKTVNMMHNFNDHTKLQTGAFGNTPCNQGPLLRYYYNQITSITRMNSKKNNMNTPYISTCTVQEDI
jgi:hypothetical protein